MLENYVFSGGGTYKNTGEHHVGCVGSRFTSLAKYTGKFLEI